MNDIVIIENKIYEIRGQKVMLDFDLAEMYEIETRVLNQSVRRNIERFPDDFMFQLTNAEANSLKDRLTSQIVISNKDEILKKTYHRTVKATKSNLTSYSLLLPS